MCQAAAFASEKLDARADTLKAGNDIAVEYQQLFKLMEENISNDDSSNKEKLNVAAQQIALSVTALAKKAQNLKDGDWVDPSDPTFIAENELNNAAKSIEAAAAKLALLKPRREFKAKVNSIACFQNLFLSNVILLLRPRLYFSASF